MNKIFKYIVDKVIFFISGVIAGILLAFSLNKPHFFIEVPVIREIVKKGVIEKPSKIEVIIKEEKTEEGKEYPEYIPLWFEYTFEDSILSATFEAKTDSVRNFRYLIFKYPEMIKYVDMERIIEKKFSLKLGYIHKNTYLLGTSYRFLGVCLLYMPNQRNKISPGVYLDFRF